MRYRRFLQFVCPARLAALSLLVVAGMLMSACGTGGGRDDQSGGDLDKYFLRDVATAQAADITVYWLGREFAAASLVFHGPHGSEFGAEVRGGGISIDYFAPVEPDEELFAGLHTTLEITTYSQHAWDLVSERWISPPTQGTSRRTVSVLSKGAEMFSAPAGTRPLNALWLVLDLSDVVVVARANAGGPMYPGGPDYNPFINNPDLLAQVLEDNLRPYPE